VDFRFQVEYWCLEKGFEPFDSPNENPYLGFAFYSQTSHLISKIT
jgi:hypothetical protein